MVSRVPQGFGEACTWLGGLRMHGTGVAQDKQRAGLLMLKGCELKNGYACRVLGDFYTTGCLEHKVLPRDMALAFKAFHLGCATDSMPDGEACSRAAQMLLRGEGCDQNQARAELSLFRYTVANARFSRVMLAAILFLLCNEFAAF